MPAPTPIPTTGPGFKLLAGDTYPLVENVHFYKFTFSTFRVKTNARLFFAREHWAACALCVFERF
jgi:hypothetical protein